MTPSPTNRPPTTPAGVDAICDKFEAAWLASHAPRIEDFLSRGDALDQDLLLRELLLAEWDLRRRHAQSIELHAYLERFPENKSSITDLWREWTTTESERDSAERVFNAMSGRSTHTDRDEDPEATREFAVQGESSQELLSVFSRQQLGGFRVLREIGRGGMGAVYEAEESKLGRRVALKVLRFGALSSADAIQRFEREAATIARLHHTNIVPVYSVGIEHGIHYFAMQLIEGRSLADLVHSGSIAPRTAANWALQAAEALNHAHQRAVIHRDVKPSNLLLDSENRIWLTDFGLARHIDDVTMSQSGALLGTPRYMSPEQASSGTAQIDHRTDLFSLGATLYELVIGKPAFDAPSTAEVIQQILTAIPEAPRRARNDVPRDLETIILKCLAKESAARYQTAGELADDLRAFLDGRPIRARKASVVRRAAYWLRRQRRSVVLSVGTAAATLLLTVLIAASFFWYRSSQRGYVAFSTDSPPLVVDVLDNKGKSIVASASVPTQQPLELASGDYRLRLSGEGRLSQTMRLDVPPGSRIDHQVDLESQFLVSELQIPHYFTKKPRDVGSDLLIFGEQGYTWKSLPRQREFSMKLLEGDKWLFGNAPALRWPWAESPRNQSTMGYDKFDQSPHVVQQPLDLDRDGVFDIVIGFRHQPWLMAISSKKGGPLWFAGREPQASGSSASGQQSDQYARQSRSGAVLGPIHVAPDANGDDVGDLLVTFINSTHGDKPIADRWIELISGANGTTLWRYDLADEWFTTTLQRVPYAFRWYINPSEGSKDYSDYQRLWAQGDPPGGTYHYAPDSAHLVTGKHGPLVAVLAGRRAVLLNALTGAAVKGPLELPFEPAQPVEWADIDSDDNPEMVALVGLRPRSSEDGFSELICWSFKQATSLWRQSLNATLPPPPFGPDDRPKWPQLVDLDKDGRLEFLVPTHHALITNRGERQAVRHVAVYQAATGKLRWRQSIPTRDLSLEHFIHGPDVNGDGQSEIFVASLWGERFDLYVDALSGADGETLWRTSHALNARPRDETQYYLDGVRWWHAGPDGGPQLVACCKSRSLKFGPSTIVLFSAKSGEVVATAQGIHHLETADLDHDGLDELLHYHPQSASDLHQGGTLDAIAGVANERWRRVGPKWQAADDLDADNASDLVQVHDDGTIRALSSATGEPLWSSRVRRPGQHLWRIRPVATAESVLRNPGDLDGDLTPDLFLWPYAYVESGTLPPIYALSGRTGQKLWGAGIEARGPRVLLAEACDVDGDRRPEVIFAAQYTDNEPSHEYATQHRLWLSVLGGGDGAVRWRKPLTNDDHSTTFSSSQSRLAIAFEDLNGDGNLDMVVPAERENKSGGFELRAYQGANGEMLWRHPLPKFREDYGATLDNIPQPLVADLNEDQSPEVYALAFEERKGQQHYAQLMALDASTGSQNWSWEAGVDYPRGGRPQLVKRDGRDLICLDLSEIVLVDGEGKTVAQTRIGSPTVWCGDLAGKGNSQILYVENREVKVVEPDLKTVVWNRKLSAAWDSSLVRILPAASNNPATVVFGEFGPARRVYGLDGRTGAELWTCSGPRPQTLGYSPISMDAIDVLTSSAADPAPLVHFGHQSTTVCRQAVNDRGSTKRQTAGTAMSFVPGFDPRLLRPLPWNIQLEYVWLQELPTSAAWSIFFSLALLGIPLAYLSSLVRRRRWSILWWALLPLVAGIATAALLIEGPDNYFGRFWSKWWVAFVTLPVLIGGNFLARVAIAKRWRTLAAWLLASVLLAALVAWVALRDYAPLLAAGQRYSTEGWYLIWFKGAYLVLCVITVGLLARPFLLLTGRLIDFYDVKAGRIS